MIRGPEQDARPPIRSRVGCGLCRNFQLVTTDGTVLGARELGRPDWPVGSVIYTGPGEPNLRTTQVLDRL
jgi:hypothetical protein